MESEGLHPDEAQPPGGLSDTPEPGEQVGIYRLRRLLGEGGMGRVFAARDQVLGRRVALKFLWEGKQSEALLAEARALAALSHPNIVAVYGVGQRGDATYMALEFLDGENLHARIRRGPLGLAEALRIMLGVGRGVQHAHARGFLHLDLKPKNILLPLDGRVRVVDFGLARVATEDARAEGFTSGFAAPEQVADEPLFPATDVWAYCETFAHALLGPNAAHDRGARERRLRRAGCPPPLARLVAAGTQFRPDERPALDSLLLEIERCHRSLSIPDAGSTNSFGLRALQEEDTHRFFGRDEALESLLARFIEEPFATVFGPSGVGKSSFVNAGFIPRARAMGPLDVIQVRPGARPFFALAHALSETEDEAESLARALEARPERLAVELERRADAHEDGALLLIIDQLEEVVTLGDAGTARTFLEALAGAASDPREPIRVLCIVRDDFGAQLSPLGFLFPLPPMGSARLRDVVQRLTEAEGCHFEDPAIVRELVEEIADSPSALPLMQSALRMLWERREGRCLTLAAWREMGGVGAALAKEAAALLASCTADERAGVRRLMLALVSEQDSRRPLELRFAVAQAGSEALVQRLIDARLVVVSQPEARAQLELVHESLIQRWPPLAAWLDETRDHRRLARDLSAATDVWGRRGQGALGLWGAEELARPGLDSEPVRTLLAASPETATFLEVSRQGARRRRTRRRWGLGLLGVGLGLLAALGWGLAAEFRAREKVAIAQAERLDLAAADVGRFELVLETFDYDPLRFRTSVGPLDGIAGWSLHPGGTLDEVGAPETGPLAPRVLELEAPPPGTLGALVETRSGDAMLVVRRAGVDGRPCPPSRLPLRNLPGFDTRDRPPRIRVRVPSCAASAAGMVEIPGGPFLFGGPGDPPTEHREREVAERREEPTFWIERTEHPNARIAPLRSLSAWTGMPPPNYAALGDPSLGQPDRPATDVDVFQARTACAFHGHDLPSPNQWVKAARGGLFLDAAGTVPNPHPERSVPWGPDMSPTALLRANLLGEDDGGDYVGSVTGWPKDQSPYGVLQLTGNVSEWTWRPELRPSGVQELRGGWADMPAEVRMFTTGIPNEREARFFSYDTGFRCVRNLSAP